MAKDATNKDETFYGRMVTIDGLIMVKGQVAQSTNLDAAR